jgi:hypothetical protein
MTVIETRLAACKSGLEIRNTNRDVPKVHLAHFSKAGDDG